MFMKAMAEAFTMGNTVVEPESVILCVRQALSSPVDVEDASYVRLIIESIRRTAEYASDIAEIVLNLTVESILL
jgi:hypothetical protein